MQLLYNIDMYSFSTCILFNSYYIIDTARRVNL